jgi:hypothetical protein
MSATSTAEAATKPFARSQITNGSRLLPGVDGRSCWARRLRDVCGLHLADLGGAGCASEAELSIIRRAACLTIELERIEARLAASREASPLDIDLYLRGANALRRLLESIGLRRRPKDVTTALTYWNNTPEASE